MNIDWSRTARIMKEATDKACMLDTPSDVRLYGETMIGIADILEKQASETGKRD